MSHPLQKEKRVLKGKHEPKSRLKGESLEPFLLSHRWEACSESQNRQGDASLTLVRSLGDTG